MKKETWIYLLAFLIGVLLVNLMDDAMGTGNSILNRYTLRTLTFQDIVYEEYFIYILCLRMRGVIALWALAKLLPERLVKTGVLIGICCLSGVMIAMSLLMNGIWGIWFFISSIFPHIFFYGFAYKIWYDMSSSYKIESERRKKRLLIVLIFVLILIGCASEAYVSPVLLEQVIKF